MQSGVNLCEAAGFKESYGYWVIKAEKKIKWILLCSVLYFFQQIFSKFLS
jgi:hypothetical protein